jgi:DNA-binding transcriptional regulator YiaG
MTSIAIDFTGSATSRSIAPPASNWTRAGAIHQPAGAFAETILFLGVLTGTGTGALAQEVSPSMFLVSGTSTVRANSTTSGATRTRSERDDSRRGTVTWLHEQSGLTWDQLGRLFGVSRRTVHLWASGAGMNAANAETLANLTRLVDATPGRTAAQRRAALLLPDRDGRSAVDRLRLVRSGSGINAPRVRPEALLDARHDLAVTET